MLNIDKPAYLVASKKYSTICVDDEAELKGLDSKLINEIEMEFEELEKQGSINVAPKVVFDKKRVGEIKALCLHICHDCNLRCKYCFADEGTYHTQRNYMTREVGIKAIDFLVANSGKRVNLEVDFFGGEPLMNFDVVKDIVAYARGIEKSINKIFSFTITTNCVLLNADTIEYLNQEMSNIVLSVDGRASVHNSVRRSVNGKDCYDLIIKNSLAMANARGDKSYYVRGTFTANNLDFATDVLYLRELGFKQISVEPVVLEETNALAIKKEHLPIILKEYERLAELYLEARSEDKWFNFFHFMCDLENGPCIKKRLSGCGAGCEYLAITPTGDIYPCHQFCEEKGLGMGNVLDETFFAKLGNDFASSVVTEKQDCLTCPAKYYCSGGCMANNLHYAGSIHNPYEISCEMMRKRFELSLIIAGIERSLI